MSYQLEIRPRISSANKRASVECSDCRRYEKEETSRAIQCEVHPYQLQSVFLFQKGSLMEMTRCVTQFLISNLLITLLKSDCEPASSLAKLADSTAIPETWRHLSREIRYELRKTTPCFRMACSSTLVNGDTLPGSGATHGNKDAVVVNMLILAHCHTLIRNKKLCLAELLLLHPLVHSA